MTLKEIPAERDKEKKKVSYGRQSTSTTCRCQVRARYVRAGGRSRERYGWDCVHESAFYLLLTREEDPGDQYETRRVGGLEIGVLDLSLEGGGLAWFGLIAEKSYTVGQTGTGDSNEP